MPPLKLASVWRIVRDVDLDGIRAAATSRVTVVVASETGSDAARLHALLSPGGEASPHPWIVSLDATADPVLPSDPAPLAALLVSRAADHGPALSRLREACARARVPVVSVVAGDTSPEASLVRTGEAARVTVSALDEAAGPRVAAALAGVVADDRRLALAAQLPVCRPHVFATLVEETARANATFALTTGLAETVPILNAPLNLGDIVVLTKNQLLMSYRLVLASGRDGDPKGLILEIAGVLGGGLLFRQAARQLVGLIPVAGLLPKIAIAYAGTYAIGRAITAWTSEGQAVTAEAVSRYSREGMDRGRALAAHLAEQAGAGRRGVSSRLERLRRFLPGRKNP